VSRLGDLSAQPTDEDRKCLIERDISASRRALL
jgi:hypothetical protein